MRTKPRAFPDPGRRDRLDALHELLAELLSDDSPEALEQLEALVAQMVEDIGRYESTNGPSFSAYQALRNVAAGHAPRQDPVGPAGQPAAGREVGRRLRVRGRQARRGPADHGLPEDGGVRDRRRSAEQIGKERVANYGVPKLAEEVDFLRASDSELVALRRSVTPLARLLASRLAVRRSRARSARSTCGARYASPCRRRGADRSVQRKPRPAAPNWCCCATSRVGGRLLTLHTVVGAGPAGAVSRGCGCSPSSTPRTR